MGFTGRLNGVKEGRSVTISAWKKATKTLMLLLAPTAPHLAEELWQRTGHEYSIHNQNWPKWDEMLASDEQTTLVVQVNGKLRDRIEVPVSITEDEAKQLALDSQKVKAHLTATGVLKVKGRLIVTGKAHLTGKGVLKAKGEVIKVIYVPGRLVNLVVR